MKALIDTVDAARMRAQVERLAAFHTRNTLSATLNEAAHYLQEQYLAIKTTECELMRYTLPKGARVPEEKEVLQVLASQKGAAAQGRRILIGGHLDSLNLQVDAATGRAPGANDDASGVVVALEVARAMAEVPHKVDLFYVGFTGEEQGLLGSRALAKRAKDENWLLEAVLNNDTVGSSSNKSGQRDAGRVRIFSDEATTENPTPRSRELARFAEWITRGRIPGFGVKLVFRKDRFGRGGDHTPFHDAGFSAVRLIEVHEEYTRQHTPDDLPEFMDWEYLANVARLNLLVFASLANADEAPSRVRITRDQSHDTTLTWQAKEGVCYAVYWRETTSPTWQDCMHVEETDKATIKGVNKDDHVFAVGAEGGVPVEAK